MGNCVCGDDGCVKEKSRPFGVEGCDGESFDFENTLSFCILFV